jgi:hypothetical protein
VVASIAGDLAQWHQAGRVALPATCASCCMRRGCRTTTGAAALRAVVR